MKILVLGNGFDLYHKLPTTYLCFLKVIEHLQNIEVLPITIGEVFAELIDDCKTIHVSYNEYKEFYDSYLFDDEDLKKLSEIKSLSKSIGWVDYLLKSYNKEAGWIDFEKEIALVIKDFERLFDLIKKSKNTQITASSIYFPSTLMPYRTKFFGIFGMEKGANKIINTYITESPYGSGKLVLDEQKVIKRLSDELSALANLLKMYLTVFVEKPLQKMIEENIVIKNPCFNDFDKIISFNYTNVYETLYTCKERGIYHIHGNLDNNIVLGINPDDSDNIDSLNTSFISFKKYYQRIVYATDQDFLTYFNSITTEQAYFNTIVVCGHSLDKTDEDIIKMLFDKANYIYVVCHNSTAVGASLKNLITIYGKSDFDILRSQKSLRFISYDEWKNVEYKKITVPDTIKLQSWH